jgi:hypothetical protein
LGNIYLWRCLLRPGSLLTKIICCRFPLDHLPQMDDRHFMSQTRRLLQGPNRCEYQNNCFAFSIFTWGIVVVALLGIGAWLLFSKWRYRRALDKGVVPANMVCKYWVINADGRGDVRAFHFPVRRVANREDVKEQCCPVCLNSKPKARSWVQFQCGHATCERCWRKLAAHSKLHASCPLCRHMLAVGEGSRGRLPGESELTAPHASHAATETPS